MTPKELIDAFETLADAPDGISRLRELVLQLAVQGKLVPQDSNDEPASELLEHIAAEKARLLKCKKIKKLKPPPPIEPDELNFRKPIGWALARLDLLGASEDNALSDGPFGSKLKKSHYVDRSRYRVIRLGNIGVGAFKDSDKSFIPKEYFESLATYHLCENDLVVASLGDPVGRACLIPEHCLPALNKADCFRVRLHESVHPSYVQLVLNSPMGAARSGDLKRGDTRGRINLTHLRMTPIPVPPVPEQRRIVARVDELMALLDRLEAAQDSREATRQALRDAALSALRDADDPETVQSAWTRIANHMDHLFTDSADIPALRESILRLAVEGRLVPQDPSEESASNLLEQIVAEKDRLIEKKLFKKPKALPPIEPDEAGFETPAGWEPVRLGSVIELISGQHLKPADYNESGNGMPYLTGPADFTSEGPVAARWTTCAKAVALSGDILLTVKGAGIGKTNIANAPETAISRQLMAIRPIVMGTRYTELLLVNLTEHLRRQQVGIAIPGIGRSDVQEAPVLIPPIAEQHRIIVKVGELMDLCDDLEARLGCTADTRESFAISAAGSLA